MDAASTAVQREDVQIKRGGNVVVEKEGDTVTKSQEKINKVRVRANMYRINQ
jgi:hypothetical protein